MLLPRCLVGGRRGRRLQLFPLVEVLRGVRPSVRVRSPALVVPWSRLLWLADSHPHRVGPDRWWALTNFPWSELVIRHRYHAVGAVQDLNFWNLPGVAARARRDLAHR